MEKSTKQMKKWKGDFGYHYTDRNTFTVSEQDKVYMKEFGIPATKLFKSVVGKLDKDIRILEIGSNSGNMLRLFRALGFKNVYGIEINKYAVETCRTKTKDVNIIEGSALDVPFKDGYFDLVFTAGVLIHISPKDIKKVISEIYRCSNRYILGIEFFADSYREVNYRGNKDLLWKTDFRKLYLDTFKGLSGVSAKKIQYQDSDKENMIFLLEKKKGKKA